MRSFTLLLVVLLCCSLPVNAQTAVIDASLVTNGEINSMNAASIIELSAWTVEGISRVDWVGDLLAVAATNAALIYNTGDWTQTPFRIEGAALDVAFSLDGELLAVADGESVRVWALDTNTLLATLDGTSPLTFNSNTLAYSDGAAAIYLWDRGTRQNRTMISGHSDRITAADFSPDGDILVTTSLDTTLRLWDVNTGEQTGFSRSRRRPLLCVEFSPSGALLASGTQRGVVRLNNLAVDTERVLSRSLRDDVTNIHFSPSGSIMLFTAGNMIQIWDTGAQSATVILPDPDGVVIDAIFNPAGTMIVSTDSANTIRLWGVPPA